MTSIAPRIKSFEKIEQPQNPPVQPAGFSMPGLQQPRSTLPGRDSASKGGDDRIWLASFMHHDLGFVSVRLPHSRSYQSGGRFRLAGPAGRKPAPDKNPVGHGGRKCLGQRQDRPPFEGRGCLPILLNKDPKTFSSRLGEGNRSSKSQPEPMLAVRQLPKSGRSPIPIWVRRRSLRTHRNTVVIERGRAGSGLTN
jgi:hypothetical protein